MAPEGWRWDGDWFINPELRLIHTLVKFTLLYAANTHTHDIHTHTYTHKHIHSHSCTITIHAQLHITLLYSVEFDADEGLNTFQEDIYEHEIRLPFTSFGHHEVYWADVVCCVRM